MAVKSKPYVCIPRVLRLGVVRRVVHDLAASVAFYRHGLGFRVVGNAGTPALHVVVVLALGHQRIEPVAATAGVRWPAPADAPLCAFSTCRWSPATSSAPMTGCSRSRPQPTAAQAGGQVRQDRPVWQLADAPSAAEPGLSIDPDGHTNELLAPAAAPQRLGEEGA